MIAYSPHKDHVYEISEGPIQCWELISDANASIIWANLVRVCLLEMESLCPNISLLPSFAMRLSDGMDMLLKLDDPIYNELLFYQRKHALATSTSTHKWFHTNDLIMMMKESDNGCWQFEFAFLLQLLVLLMQSAHWSTIWSCVAIS